MSAEAILVAVCVALPTVAFLSARFVQAWRTHVEEVRR